MNIHQAKRINRCKEITFALKRIGGANSALFITHTPQLQNSGTPRDSPAPQASGWVSAKHELRSSRKAPSESNPRPHFLPFQPGGKSKGAALAAPRLTLLASRRSRGSINTAGRLQSSRPATAKPSCR